MGYRVENACYGTKQEAEQAYFGMVKPVIGTDGKLYQLQYNGKQWTHQGIVINASLPQCDIGQNFKDGMILGWGIFAIAASVWFVKLIARLLEGLS